MQDFAEIFATALGAPFSTQYFAINATQLYPAAGNAMDWSYGEFGSLSLGLELRPDAETSQLEGFVLPPEQIVEVCDELAGGVLALAEFVTNEDPLDPGEGSGGDESSTAAGSLDTSSTDGSMGTAGTSGDAATNTSVAMPGATESDSDSPGTTATNTGDAPASEGEGSDGCACASQNHRSPSTWMALALLGFVTRGRSRKNRAHEILST